jgi:hypothetical protein
MAIYANLSPQDALAKWYQLRQTPPDQLASLTPAERAEATSPGGMETLASENPAAWKLMATGTAPASGRSSRFMVCFRTRKRGSSSRVVRH